VGRKAKNSSVDTWAQRRFAGTPRTCSRRRADRAGLDWGLGSIGVASVLALALAAACGDDSEGDLEVEAARPAGFEATSEDLAAS
jgi:hypothetical protein